MNKSFNFLSRLSGPLSKQYKRRRDTKSRFWRFWDHVQDSVVKGNMTLISSSSQFITSVPFLIKFSSVTLEPQTSACWMLQSKSPMSGTSSEGDCTAGWQAPKKIKIWRVLFTSHTALTLKELHWKKRVFLVFLVLLQILHVECSLSCMESTLGLRVKPGLCLSCWFGVFPSFCSSVWLKEPGAWCMLGRHPDSVNIFDFRGRLKIKLFCVTSSIIRPGLHHVVSYFRSD